MIFCLVCGIGNRAGSRFCNACGRPVGEVTTCPECETPNPPGSRFCNACGAALQPAQLTAPRAPQALRAPDWRESIAAAAMLGADDATWATPPAPVAPEQRRSLTGFEPLSPEEMELFAAPLTPRRSMRYPVASAALVRARSWDARRGPTRAPEPITAGDDDPSALCERIMASIVQPPVMDSAS